MIKPSYKNYSNTTVRSEKTQAEITAELARYGIYSVQHTTTELFFSVAFQATVDNSHPVTIRIDVPYDRKKDQEDKYGFRDQRRKYRALYFYIKSLLIAWDDGIKTFSEVFMPHIVLPDGNTVSQNFLPVYAHAVQSGQIGEVKLLPNA